jgi:hypothetical protein
MELHEKTPKEIRYTEISREKPCSLMSPYMNYRRHPDVCPFLTEKNYNQFCISAVSIENKIVPNTAKKILIHSHIIGYYPQTEFPWGVGNRQDAMCEIPITNDRVIHLDEENIKWFHTNCFNYQTLNLNITNEKGEPIKFIDDDVKIDIVLTLKNCEDCRILQNRQPHANALEKNLSCKTCQNDKKVMSKPYRES